MTVITRPEQEVPIPWNSVEWDGQGPNLGSLNEVLQNLQRQILGAGGSGATASLGFATILPDDGVGSASLSLAAAIATGQPIALTKDTAGVYLLTTNVTITSPLWGFGGRLKPAAGVTVTLNCPIYGPDSVAMFDISAGGTFSGTPQVRMFMVNWFFGTDRSGVADSYTQLQACLTLCTGQFKPSMGLLAGDYKCLTGLLKPDSIYCPVIQGVGGGTVSAGLQSCRINFSASALTATNPAIRLLGGSGQLGNGGLRDVELLGNNACIGLQISGMCGVLTERCTFTNFRYSVDIWNERASAAAEWNVFRDCVWTTSHLSSPTDCYAMRFIVTGGLTSFHGVGLYNCWIGLQGDSAGFFIGNNAEWYDGHLDTQIFFDGLPTRTRPQYVFIHEGGAGTRPVQISGGGLKLEGGSGFGRLAKEQTSRELFIYYSGGVHGLDGFMWGSFRQVDNSVKLGPLIPPGPGNGLVISRRRRYSDSNRILSNGANVAVANTGTAMYYDVIIESFRTGTSYYWRKTGITTFSDTTLSSTGIWLDFNRQQLWGATTHEFGNIVVGSSETTNVQVIGAVLGQPCRAGIAIDLQGLTISAYISAADTAQVTLSNNTAGAINLVGANLITVFADTDTNNGWRLADGGGWGYPIFGVDANNALTITNANYPASVSTTLTVAAVTLASVLEVATVVGMVAGDRVNLELDDGLHWVGQIASVGATSITLTTSIPGPAAIGNAVVTHAVFFRYNALQLAESQLQYGRYAYLCGTEPI